MPKKQFETITFKASLPAMQSAIQTHGAGDGFLVKLLVPQTESLAIMKLGVCTARVFDVTIKVPLESEDVDFSRSAG